MTKYDWEVFICHASEDKEAVARPLANHLATLGLEVWLDETEIHLGDSLRTKIDSGLAQSRFGIVVLSPNFFSKNWTRSELDGLLARESDGVKVVLPIWHNITLEQIRSQSPILAGRLAASTNEGMAIVANKIRAAIDNSGPKARAKRKAPFDFDIEIVRALIAAGKSPPPAWRPFIKELSFEDGKYKFDNLDALVGLDRLERLDLFDIEPRNIDALAGLQSLQWLYLGDSDSHDIGALTHLDNLEYLDLNMTQVQDIGPLSNLAKLKHLNLSCKNTSDISALQNLNSLEFLSLTGTQVRDITPLRALTNLRTLALGYLVDDVSPLSELCNLQCLCLWHTEVSDLTPLSSLKELRALDIDKTDIKEVAALRGLLKLRFIDAVGTDIQDTSSLAHIPDLEIHLGGEEYNENTKIDLTEEWQVWYWTRQFSMEEKRLRSLIAKFGNSAAALYRELGKP
jgi:hypothetical protein